jgi:hypothetical protein
MIGFVLLCLSLVFALLATVNWPPLPISLGWLSFALFVAAQLVVR